MSDTASALPHPPSQFPLRSIHFLRVSRDAIIPLRLFLASPHTFTQLKLEEILAVLKGALPKHIRFQADGSVQVVSSLKPSNPAHYTTPDLQFFYYFYESTVSLKLVLPTEKGEARFIAACEANPDTAAIAIPGDLQHHKLCPMSLCIVVIPHNNKDKVTDSFDFDFWQSAGIELHQISKYFSAYLIHQTAHHLTQHRWLNLQAPRLKFDKGLVVLHVLA